VRLRDVWPAAWVANDERKATLKQRPVISICHAQNYRRDDRSQRSLGGARIHLELAVLTRHFFKLRLIEPTWIPRSFTPDRIKRSEFELVSWHMGVVQTSQNVEHGHSPKDVVGFSEHLSDTCVMIEQMVTSLLLALMGHANLSWVTPVSGNSEWEELPSVQQTPGYHPMLRFNPSSTFIFATPYYTAEGHYQQQDGHYFFKPELAIQLGNAEVNKLVADLPPENQAKLHHDYACSLATFDADYNESTGALHLNYTVDRETRSFTLYPYTEGDRQLSSALSDSERGFAGLWHAPEPFPEMLDARVRYRIGGLEGLEQFSKEAKASDAAQFGLLDLRVDKTFRIHAKVGNWERAGSILKLIVGRDEIDLTISSDGSKLLGGGKPVYVRD